MARESYSRQLWRGEYGHRSSQIDAVITANEEGRFPAITQLNVYVNNIPYSLEWYVDIEINDGMDVGGLQCAQIRAALAASGLSAYGDETPDDLIYSMQDRRFNRISLTPGMDRDFVEAMFEFADRPTLEAKGYGTAPLTSRSRLFLSYQGSRRDEVARLRDALLGRGLATWFDQTDVLLGAPIAGAINEGVEASRGVIFWISQEFLESNWCKYEMEGFVHRYALDRNLTMISVVESSAVASLPSFLGRYKYLEIPDAEADVSQIANEIAAVMTREEPQ